MLSEPILKCLQQGRNFMHDGGSVHCCDLEALFNIDRERKYFHHDTTMGGWSYDHVALAASFMGDSFTSGKIAHYITVCRHLEKKKQSRLFLINLLQTSDNADLIVVNTINFAAFWQLADRDILYVLKLIADDEIVTRTEIRDVLKEMVQRPLMVAVRFFFALFVLY